MLSTPVEMLDELLVSKNFMEDPYPVLRRLREEDPVHWSDSFGGWVLTRYDDVVTTFKDTNRFSNEGRLAKASAYLPEETRARFKPLADHYSQKSLVHSDPPEHTRFRELLNKVFNPRMVESMRPRIQEVTNELLRDVQERGGMDVVKDLANPLPVTILSAILGVPKPDGKFFKTWADDILAFQGVNKPPVESLERSQTAIVEMREYLGKLLKQKVRQPGEDLLSKLAAPSEGDKLSEPELISTCVTLLTAGHETTTGLIGNGIYLLLRHSDQWRLLQENRSLLPSAVEEILRFESPIARQPRLMKQDAEMRGKQLRRGDMVFQMLNAANRDPAYFEEPDQIDVRRRKNPHLAFGHGIHLCIGAPLARAESQTVLSSVLDCLPNLRLVNEKADWELQKPNVRMLKSLHVQF